MTLALNRRVAGIAILISALASGCYGPSGQFSPGATQPGIDQGPVPSASAASTADQLSASGDVQLLLIGDRTLAISRDVIADVTSAAPVRVGSVPGEGRIHSPVAMDRERLVMATTDGFDLEVLSSDDAAATWSGVGAVRFTTVDPVISLDVAVHDALVVVVAGEQSGSAFRFAQIASSADGGTSWDVDAAPVGGTLSYADGWFWLVGGVMGDEVYRSANGKSWEAVQVPLDAADWTAGRVFEAPGFGAVIPVTIHRQDEPGSVALLGTGDGGHTWQDLGATSTPASASGSTVPLDIASDGSWIVAFADGSAVVAGVLGNPSATVVEEAALPADVTDVLINRDTVTVVAMPSTCPGGKPSCRYATLLLQSDDTGRSWTEIE